MTTLDQIRESSRKVRRILPRKPGAPGSREWAETLVSATIGAPRYLLGLDGALYWSPFKDEDEREAGPCGAATYATPLAAAAAVTMAVGMVRLPEGWEIAEEESQDASMGIAL